MLPKRTSLFAFYSGFVLDPLKTPSLFALYSGFMHLEKYLIFDMLTLAFDSHSPITMIHHKFALKISKEHDEKNY